MTVTYQSDYYGWIQQQATLLRSGQLADLDIANLIEELESLGVSERKALVSSLTRLYQHLLKWIYQPSKRSTSWVATINITRREITDLLKENPSFKPWLPEAIHKAYQNARDEAYGETGLAIETFPPDPPFTWEEAMNMEVKYKR